MNYFRQITENIGDRLRLAREELNLSQEELAAATGVSRATQINYERGETEPNTAYLRSVQKQGIDVAELLFGSGALTTINWALVQRCSENVDFYCLRTAPTCPASFRWQMIAKLYGQLLLQNPAEPHSSSRDDLQDLLAAIWNQLK